MNLHTPERGPDESLEAYKQRRKDSKKAAIAIETNLGPATNWPTDKPKLGKAASKLKRKRTPVKNPLTTL